jgi:hypothetical protein
MNSELSSPVGALVTGGLVSLLIPIISLTIPLFPLITLSSPASDSALS